ncbi:adenylylsulfate kinase [Paenibacillus algorifonticola]|uniref:Adenylyl-sulfate kinase n=1 Tax=Paenibacillus algorifonticola TaxID=684063 RepID=A0A1I2B6K6_9BACL|nr:adenylyl-sulfate kinase [Paenibacillus algorifonticola]SFE51822.1 adenylylsulfate kinase [Paenibacillus algorifonticola]
MDQKSPNVQWHSYELGGLQQAGQWGYYGGIVWLTGLPASGKSSIAASLHRQLQASGVSATVLDGDNLRYGLNRDLGFSAEDRRENVRRTAEVAKLFAGAGSIAIAALVSPLEADRALARAIAAPLPYVEVYVNCPLAICEQRDPKGLYSKARRGEIPLFTGISAPYEAPLVPELELFSGEGDADTAAVAVIRCLQQRGILTDQV